MRPWTLKPLTAVAKLLFSFLLTSWVSGTVSAAVVNYDESVMGDLTNPGCPPFCAPPTSIGTLGIGTNTVSGHMFVDFGANALVVGSDSDGFSFAVPAGAMLEGVSFALSFSATGGLIDASTSYSIGQNPIVFPMLSLQTVDFFTAVSPVSMFGGVLPLGPGNYLILQDGGAMICNPFPCRWDVDYTWSLAVVGPAGIPEPSSFSLVVLLLMGILVGRRRFAGFLRISKAKAARVSNGSRSTD